MQSQLAENLEQKVPTVSAKVARSNLDMEISPVLDASPLAR